MPAVTPTDFAALAAHGFRRSLATHLEGAGLGQAAITRILRHGDSRTTIAWCQGVDERNLTNAVEHFDF